MEKGRQVELHQRVRAEQDVVVAAASIMARAGFLERLEALSREVGIALPKGATHVIGAGREVVAKGGPALLAQVAKLHFKTTGQILGESAS
jgi:ribonuclease HIII